MHPSPCIDQSLAHEINAQKEDERSNDHDGDVSDNDGPTDKDSESADGEHDAGNSAVTATAHKKNGVGVYKVVLWTHEYPFK